jgi:hypothetical protein
VLARLPDLQPTRMSFTHPERTLAGVVLIAFLVLLVVFGTD